MPESNQAKHKSVYVSVITLLSFTVAASYQHHMVFYKVPYCNRYCITICYLTHTVHLYSGCDFMCNVTVYMY